MNSPSWNHGQELTQVYCDELSPREYVYGFHDQATPDASRMPDTEIGERTSIIDLRGHPTPGPTRTPGPEASYIPSIYEALLRQTQLVRRVLKLANLIPNGQASKNVED